MGRNIYLDDLHTHLESAKQKLSLERANLLDLYPLDDRYNREEYAFAYVRAERIGMQAINRRLADVAWLPMQLDPKAEVMADKRAALKRWLASPMAGAPDSDAFGNDFIHVLTRCGLRYGWTHPLFYKSAIRVANLFRDLSCLIGLVYYGTWLTEHRVQSLRLTDPTDLCRTAEEITRLIQSPEMERLLQQQREQSDRNAQPIKQALAQPEKKRRPSLRLIKNDDSLLLGDPVTV